MRDAAVSLLSDAPHPRPRTRRGNSVPARSPDPRIPSRLPGGGAMSDLAIAAGDAAATEGAVKRPVQGRLERVESGILHGWVRDAESEDPVRFALLINEVVVGEFLADILREDLVRNGVGNGRHAFQVRIKRDWLTVNNTIALSVLPEGQRLADEMVLHRPALAIADDQHRSADLDSAARGSSSESPSHTLRVVRTEPTAKQIIAAMRSWSTQEIVSFFSKYESEVMLGRAKRLFRDRDWAELAEFLPTSLQSRPRRVEFNTIVGRALLYAGANEDAATVLAGAARVAPNSANAQFYSAVASARARKLEAAVSYGRAAVTLAPENGRFLYEHGTHCRRLASASSDGDLNLRKSLLDESIEAFVRALEFDGGRADQCLLQITRSELELDRHADAIATVERLLDLNPDHVEGLLLLSQALLAMNRIKEALAVAERLVALDPLREGPRFQLRSLQSLVQDHDVPEPTFGVARWLPAEGSVCVARLDDAADAPRWEEIGRIDFGADPALAVASLGVEWLLLTAKDPAALLREDGMIGRLRAAANSWAGRLVSSEGRKTLTFWRRDLLVNLAESGAIRSIASLPEDLGEVETIVSTWTDRDPVRKIDQTQALDRLPPGTVVALSRHGVVKFGGGEHFLDSMAQHYADMGHDPIVVGCVPERIGEEGEIGGRRYAFVDMKPASLRKYFLRTRPRLVHVLSGLGYQVAEALEYLDIPFVYGVHFWRDCLGKTENDTRFFAAHDREPIPRPAFRYIIEKAATIYSNSEYTRAVLEESFALRTPVVYSLPREVDDLLPGTEAEADEILKGLRDYILLANTKSDKGFDLLVEVARRVPSAKFLAIASQTDRREAERAVGLAGVSNILVVDHTHRMDILYSRARAVAVGSYRFVETFSRVCIEAQRYGKPVLGSTIGNVPYLLRESGVILPEDAEAWAEAVLRLYEDESHYAALCQAARQNAERYAYASQRAAVDGIVSTLPSPILIGVGSGIGNMLHVSPMIRNISRRLGRKIDLVMTEDHQHSLFLLQNDEYVSSVYSLRQELLRRRYDTVFVTHSFGNARLPFQGEHVLYARDWMNFAPEGPFHETIYNLEAAQAVLGIPYDPEDVYGHYIGNVKYTPPEGAPRIGIHGGSKEGFWRSKRWPGHAELAARLQARGYEVASFGVGEEHVPGTIDLTGGAIAEMVEQMRRMSYLISNDSGLMNIAHALGMPVLGLFGPTNALTRGPIGPHGRSLSVSKDCAPCEVTKSGRSAFLSGQCHCIAELSVDTVYESVLDHMRASGLIEPAAEIATARRRSRRG